MNSGEWHYLQPEDNHTDARRRIKVIRDTCHGCSRLDIPGMAIQYKMLIRAEENLLSLVHGSSQTPSLRIRFASKRAKV